MAGPARAGHGARRQAGGAALATSPDLLRPEIVEQAAVGADRLLPEA